MSEHYKRCRRAQAVVTLTGDGVDVDFLWRDPGTVIRGTAASGTQIELRKIPNAPTHCRLTTGGGMGVLSFLSLSKTGGTVHTANAADSSRILITADIDDDR